MHDWLEERNGGDSLDAVRLWCHRTENALRYSALGLIANQKSEREKAAAADESATASLQSVLAMRKIIM